MRLIDADNIDFSEIICGQSEFAKDIREAAYSLINLQPTVYDVEEVINKIEMYIVNNPCDAREQCPWEDDNTMSCAACGAMGALEIVKKQHLNFSGGDLGGDFELHDNN